VTIDPPRGAIALCRLFAVADVLFIMTSHVGTVAPLWAAGTAARATSSTKQHAGLMVGLLIPVA
jgi:hypothetical protein